MRGSVESLHVVGKKVSWGKYVLGLIPVGAQISNQPVS